MTFKALLATKSPDAISTHVVEMNERELMPGDVTISVEYSSVNFKDALAITGRADIIRTFPLVAGIDLAGTVEASAYPGIAAGDRVVVNGWELSQTHHGGFAQKARVKGEWLVKLPSEFSTRDAMAIGTAGYPAMLSILALEHNAPQAVCIEAWSRLVRDLDVEKLDRAMCVVGLAEVPAVARQILEGKVQGRTVVDVDA